MSVHASHFNFVSMIKALHASADVEYKEKMNQLILRVRGQKSR